MAASSPLPVEFNKAFDKLKQSVSPGDAFEFQSTTLQDVWKAARDLERVQRERQSVRNLRRIEPFFKAIEQYSKIIEVLCQGTPYLCFIWVSSLDERFCLRHQSTDTFRGSHQANASGNPSFLLVTTRTSTTKMATLYRLQANTRMPLTSSSVHMLR